MKAAVDPCVTDTANINTSIWSLFPLSLDEFIYVPDFEMEGKYLNSDLQDQLLTNPQESLLFIYLE
jgi:hypothetical protein